MFLNQALGNQTLKLIKPLSVSRIFPISLFIIILMVCTQTMASSTKPTQHAASAVHTQARGKIDQSLVEEVFSKICEKNIAYPTIVMRQAILETGWFRSKFLMDRNNLFGFKHQKYLQFEHFEESIYFYKKWQDKHFNSEVKDYYQFLEKIKYGTPGYTRHLHHITWNRECQQGTVEE